MTELEYSNSLLKIEHDYTAAKKQLAIDYAKSKRMFNIGDIIKHTNGVIIEIKSFGFTSYGNFPQPTYKGIELRKDLVPKKNGNIETIWGNEGVELIKCAI